MRSIIDISLIDNLRLNTEDLEDITTEDGDDADTLGDAYLIK